jgi:pyruvate/2-oxoglutarate dehydrogenase complex dihydrolipoamide acyltransferase (E2) component
MKQLNGWKATVENLTERFDDLVKQQQLLMEIDEGQAALHGSSSSRAAAAGATPQGPAAEAAAAAADAAAAAIAAEEGAAGPLAAGSVVPRSSVLTAQHHVQLNKLRCVAGTGWLAAVVQCVCTCGSLMPA